jgi:hypothetical protein
MIRYAALMIPFLFVGALPSVAQSEADWEFTDGKLIVRVVDAQGQPVSGIEVVYVDARHQDPLSMLKPEEYRHTQATSAVGRAVFTGLRPGLALVFAQSGELGGWVQVKGPSPVEKTVQVELVLRPPFLQSGIVRDTSGQPLEGAKIWIRHNVVGAVSGPDGRYAIPFLDEFNHLLVEHEEFGSVEINNFQNHDVTLPTRGRIHVRVESPDGAPVSDVSVVCTAQGGSGRLLLSSTTDSSGRVTVDGLPAPSKIDIFAQKKVDGDRMTANYNLDLPANGSAEAVLTLKSRAARPTSHISGRVVMLDTGEPVQATIFIGRSKRYVTRLAGHTEKDGTFHVGELDFGDYLIWVAADDVTLRPKGGLLQKAYVREDDAEEDLVVEMERGAAIRGRAVSADGVPLAQTPMSVTQILPNGTQPLPGYIRGLYTYSQGEFVLESLMVTGYPLELNLMGKAVRVEPLVVGEITDDVEIVVEHLLLDAEKMPTYSGRLVDEEGNPITGARIQAKPLQETVTDASGRFGFRYDYKPRSVMSVHIDGEAAMEAIQVPTDAGDDIRRGGQRDGAKMTFRVTEAGQILGQVTLPPEEGQDSYDPTDPIPGAVVRLTSKVNWKQSAYTRADGSFEISTDKDGAVEFSVSNPVYHYTPLSIDSSDEPITLVEGREILLNADDTSPAIRLVARRANSTVVAGTIRDESGSLLDARVTYYIRDSMGGSLGHLGGFFWRGPRQGERPQTPDDPFLMLVSKEGYQPVMLVRGRDFDLGDRDVQVVLKRGPFPEGESVFTAVTGYSEERGVPYPGRSFKRDVHRWASTASVQVVAPRTNTQEAAPRTFRLHALLPDGQPAKRLFTANAMSFGQGGPRPELTAATMLLQDSTQIDRFSGLDGWFTWPKTDQPSRHSGVIWVWAKDTARHLFSYNQNTPDGEIFEIALERPASLTIRVTTYERKPAQGFLIVPAGTYTFSHDGLYGAPTTDMDGVFRLDNLPPGRYDYLVYMPRSEDESGWQKLSPQFVSFDLTAGSDSEAKVVHGIPKSGSAEELLLQFSRKRRNTQPENEVAPEIDPGTHNRLAALVTKKLKALPGRYSWESSESQELIRAAGYFQLDGALPSLRRQFKQRSIDSGARADDSFRSASVIAQLAGPQAISFFTNVAASDLDWNQRAAAVVALGSIGTPESMAEFVRLRDAAYGTTGAPVRQTSQSDEEAIIEAAEMTFNVLSWNEDKRVAGRVDIRTHYIQIENDTARLSAKLPWGDGTQIHMGRINGEWMVVRLGGTMHR